MSLKKIEQVKADKGFKIWDLIIYGTIAVLVIILFIVIFTTRDNSTLTGIRITVKAQVVFEYDFNEKRILNIADTVKVKEDEKGITVTIQTDDDKNVVYIDKTKNTAKMIEANCRGRQCEYFATMDDNSDFIYSSPHGLKVQPLK